MPPVHATIANAEAKAPRSSHQMAEACPVQIGTTCAKWNHVVATAAAMILGARMASAERRVGRQQQSASRTRAMMGARAENTQRIERKC